MKFYCDLNLDDPHENEDFLKIIEGKGLRAIAKELGFQGKGSLNSAQALVTYAKTKSEAMSNRRAGKISLASEQEKNCDRIYSQWIQPNIVCW